MVKLIGILLIASGLISLALGVVIDLKYSNTFAAAGNVVLSVPLQAEYRESRMSFFDYIEATTLSYSIASLIAGAIFLFRVK